METERRGRHRSDEAACVRLHAGGAGSAVERGIFTEHLAGPHIAEAHGLAGERVDGDPDASRGDEEDVVGEFLDLGDLGIGVGQRHDDRLGRHLLDHVRGQQAGPPGRHHHDVRGSGVRGEILRAGVAERHGGVLGPAGQQQAESATHGDPAPDDGDVGARDRHPVAAQQFHDAARGARQRAGLAQDELAEVGRVQAVRVLGRVHPVQHGVGVEPGGQRQLDDVPGAGRVGVELVDHRLHLRLGGVEVREAVLPLVLPR